MNSTLRAQSRPDSGFGFQVVALGTFQGVPSSLESGCYPSLTCFQDPVDPSFRALSERLNLAVRRQKFNEDSLSFREMREGVTATSLDDLVSQNMFIHQLSKVTSPTKLST